MERLRSVHRDQRAVTLVELLVVMSLLSVVLGAIWTVVWSSMRTERFTTEMRVVMDDGRVSLGRIRKEVRAARQILPTGSDASRLHFWVDQDQDNDLETNEEIWYCVRKVGGSTCVDPSYVPTTGDKFELARWDEASGMASARVIARTLLNHRAFEYCELPQCTSSVPPEDSRVIAVAFELDMKDTARGPSALDVAATVRLRNVD